MYRPCIAKAFSHTALLVLGGWVQMDELFLVVELAGGGFVINGSPPTSLHILHYQSYSGIFQG